MPLVRDLTGCAWVGIDGLNELVATQLERLEEQQQQSEARLERKLDALSASIEAIGKQLGAGR